MSRWLIVGLGNPGGEYAHTRHNVGFDIVDRLCARVGAKSLPHGVNCELSQVALGGSEVHLLKPLTFMNSSGEAVAPMAAELGVEPERILVVYDCLDLEFGRIRVRGRGSSGGHNGVQSILDELGTDRFVRLRVGIGRPQGTTIEYVLSPWNEDEADAMNCVLGLAEEAALTVVGEGVDTAMNRYNGIVPSAEDSDRDAQNKEMHR
ncbi:MAG: aminoacyl-tRNA hydrolase [Lentisphaeria bacterium]|nr:aminoacyl-tRNA hydrolase [Lentisphaeria bacterium]